MRDACGCEVVAWKKGATYRCGGGEFWQKDRWVGVVLCFWFGKMGKNVVFAIKNPTI